MERSESQFHLVGLCLQCVRMVLLLQRKSHHPRKRQALRNEALFYCRAQAEQILCGGVVVKLVETSQFG